MTVTFAPLGISAESRPDETLLDAARRERVPIGNSCGGIGVCARCRVQIVAGRENLTEPTRMEVNSFECHRILGHERLACQTVVRGDCTVTTTYWGPGR